MKAKYFLCKAYGGVSQAGIRDVRKCVKLCDPAVPCRKEKIRRSRLESKRKCKVLKEILHFFCGVLAKKGLVEQNGQMAPP